MGGGRTPRRAHPTRRRAMRRRAVRSPTAPLGRMAWRSAARSGANRGRNRSSPRSASVRPQEPPDGFTSDTRLSDSVYGVLRGRVRSGGFRGARRRFPAPQFASAGDWVSAW
jgi:hypothetical protein